MSFEAPNRILGEIATGTHSFCPMICRRYLQRQKLLNTQFDEDNLLKLTKKLCGHDQVVEDAKLPGLLRSCIISNARNKHPEAIFLSRIVSKGIFFILPPIKEIPTDLTTMSSFNAMDELRSDKLSTS